MHHDDGATGILVARRKSGFIKMPLIQDQTEFDFVPRVEESWFEEINQLLVKYDQYKAEHRDNVRKIAKLTSTIEVAEESLQKAHVKRDEYLRRIEIVRSHVKAKREREGKTINGLEVGQTQ